MPEESRDRYHEVLLNDQEENSPQNIINGPKFWALVSTFTLIILARLIINRLNDLDIQYIIPIIIAFVVSCYSSFIGHKKLFIGSFILFIFSIFFMTLASREISVILFFFLNLSIEILNIQIYIQICGQWPSQFVRVLAGIILLSVFFIFTLRQMSELIILLQGFTKESFYCFFLTLFSVILLVIIKGVSSFKQPTTESVNKDIIKAVFHYKLLIFTLLFISTLLLCILQLTYSTFIFKYVNSGGNEESILFFLLSFLLLSISRKLKYQSTLILAVLIIILELLGILLLFRIDLFGYSQSFYIFVTINILIYCLAYAVPQYQVLLRNIDINNLDFASTYQQFAFTMVHTSVYFFLKNQLEYYPSIMQQLIQGMNIWLPMLMCLVFVLGIIFYGALGFRKYFYKSNQSQILEQEQELEASQILI
ncbi:hypothetical protein pb186bvf_009181 [Paramecium bursaria]